MGAPSRAVLLVCLAGALPGVPGGCDTAIFQDVATEVGLDFVHFNGMTGELYFSEMAGSGGGLLDFDGDGDLDVFLVQGDMLEPEGSPGTALVPARHSWPPSDRLYRNVLVETGRLGFVDVTEVTGFAGSRGYGMGVATGDFDNDGHTDLYVANLGANRLWRNRGPGEKGAVSFEDVTSSTGTDDPAWSVGATFFDFDRDGWLDLFVVNYVDFRFDNHKPCYDRNSSRVYCGPESYGVTSDRLFRNLGRGADGRVSFQDVTVEAGLSVDRGAGLSVVAGDFDADGWTDLYVANDGHENFLWRNRGEGSFENIAIYAGAAVNMLGASEAGMGIAAGDVDDDGDLDLFVTHLAKETNTLYMNDGQGHFEDRTLATGLGPASFPFTSFGTGWLDYDNDGRLDLMVASGAVKQLPNRVREGDPYPLDQTNQLFRNLGDRFEEVTDLAGSGLAMAEVSRGLAVGDLDNDGDPDTLVVNNNGPVRLLLNEGKPRHHWLGLRLVGGEPLRDQVGTQVSVHQSGRPTRHRWSRTDGSYASASDPRVLVGLGESREPPWVQVQWPDGLVERFGPLEIDRYVTLERGRGGASLPALESVPHPLIEGFEAGVADQLREARRNLEEALGRSGVPSGEIASAFARLGGLYQTYEFSEAAAACFRNATSRSPDEARWWYYLGHAYRDTGELDRAVAAFERTLGGRVDDVPTLLWLARSELDLGRLAEAQEHLTAALALRPNFAPTFGLLGDLALARRDFTGAIGQYTEALRRQPRASLLHNQLATAYRALGDRENAEKHLRLRGPGKVKFPDLWLRELQALNRSSKFQAEAGRDAFQQGRFETAVRHFRRALESDPDDVVVLVNLGASLARSGRKEEAIEVLRDALRRHPDHPTLHFNLAKIVSEVGAPGEAIDQYRQALAADPDFRDAHFNLANLLYRLGRSEEAAEQYSRVRELDPGSAAALRGEALALGRSGRFETARELLEVGHERFPDDVPIADALARLLAAAPDESLRDGPRALAIAIANLEAQPSLDHLQSLAMAYAEVGELDSAVDWQQRAVDLAERAGLPDEVEAMTRTLERYRAGEVPREPW